MPNFFDDLFRRGKRGAGDFLTGYLGRDTDRDMFPGVGGLLGGMGSLYESVTSPLPPARPPRPEIEGFEEGLEFAEPEEIEVIPGVTTIGGRRGGAREESALPGTIFTPEETKRLVANVSDPSMNLSEIKLPDGTTVKGTVPEPTAGGVPEGGGEAGGFLDFFGTPEFQYLAGRMAQAVVPDRRHGAHIAGGVGAELGVNRAYDEYFQRLQSGEPVDSLNRDMTFNIIPPELKEQALKDVLAEKKFGLAEEQQRVSAAYTQQLIEQSKAITAATPTVQERFDHETMLTMLRKGTDMDQWQVWGHGQMRNRRTGEIVKVPVAPRGTGADVRVQDRQWYKQAYNEAVRNPEVLQYVKGTIVVVGPDGTPVFQWTDPIKGQEALQKAMLEKLKLFQAQGLVPPGYLELTGIPSEGRPEVPF